MRIGEIEPHAGLLLDVVVVVEFRSIVSRDGMDAGSMLADEPRCSGCHGFHGAIGQLADQGVTGSTLLQGDDAVLAAGAHDGVDFPVADLATVVDDGGPFTEIPLDR